ncbi:hypothetical protein GVAV_001394 [Gurleya vavrai]
MKVSLYIFYILNALVLTDIDEKSCCEEDNIRYTNMVELIDSLQLHTRKCEIFLKNCKEFMPRSIKISTKETIKKFLNSKIYEEFKTYVNSELKFELQSELSIALIRIGNSISSKNSYAKVENYRQILDDIVEYEKKKIYKKDLKTILTMSNYIEYDKKMAFYRYYEGFFYNFERSTYPIYFKYITKRLHHTEKYASSMIELILLSKEFRISIKNLLKDCKNNILKNNQLGTFDEFNNCFDQGLDKVFEDIKNYVIKSEQNQKIYGFPKFLFRIGDPDYEISYSNPIYRNVFIRHFKISMLNPLKYYGI